MRIKQTKHKKSRDHSLQKQKFRVVVPCSCLCICFEVRCKNKDFALGVIRQTLLHNTLMGMVRPQKTQIFSHCYVIP